MGLLASLAVKTHRVRRWRVREQKGMVNGEPPCESMHVRMCGMCEGEEGKGGTRHLNGVFHASVRLSLLSF